MTPRPLDFLLGVCYTVFKIMSLPKTSRNKKWLKLYQRGYSVRHIAQLDGVHFTTVHEVIQRENKKTG